MLNKNIETFIACDSEYSDADIVLFGAPFDGTVSYRPGTRFAPKAIRAESYGVETYSPYQDKDLCDCKIFDSGDLELPFGNPEKVLHEIEARTKIILDDNKLPFMFGGEHLVTLGAVRAVAKKYPDLHIVHFDAHADLRDEYYGEKLSHAAVLRRCHEIVGDGKIFQFGIRSGDKSEFEWGKAHVETVKFDFKGLEKLSQKIGNAPVYFTLDLDILDPSIFSGTGTPEAGGVSFNDLREASEYVCSKLNVIACDINELSPQYDMSGVSTATAIKIAREMLLALHKEQTNK